MAGLREVAKVAGVSVATVSRALSGHPHVDEDTRARVRAAASRLDYQPNALARALRRNHTMTVGLVIPDILNPFYSASAAVVQSVLEEHGYGLVLAISNNDPQTEARCLARLLEQQVDGIVHIPCRPFGALVARDSERHVPVVEMNRHTEGNRFDGVISDERDGAAQIARHLVGLGHKRIAMIAGSAGFSTTRDRVKGFREAILEAGLVVDDIYLGDYTENWGGNALRQMLDRKDPPTAVFAASSLLVLGALTAARDMRLRIPLDVSLAGFGNAEWYELCDPPITTFALPLREMGMMAAQLLLDRMAAPPTEPVSPITTRLTGRLILRGSTAAPGKVTP